MKKTIIALAMLVLFTAGAAFAGASPQTANMTVQAQVIVDCTIGTVGTMDFGSLGLSFVTTDTTTSATISYTCTSGTVPTVTIGQGLHAAGGSTDAAPLRQMASGGNNIAYNLYTSNTYATVWGNTAGTGVAQPAATGAAQTTTVYGKAFHANVPTGSYSDTVVVTYTF
jgi:spore coat protein U domain-containing protein, fimbrial subunit CupE1/2/3/6